MSGIRAAALFGVLLALLLLTTQSGAFSAATADRSVTVAVVEDEDAYLGIERWTVSETGQATTPLLRVTNHLSTTVEVHITVVESGGAGRAVLNSVQGPDTLHVGESALVSAGVTCAGGTTAEPATLRIHASGSGVSVTAHRIPDIDCASAHGSGEPSTTPAVGATPPSSTNPETDTTTESTAS